MRCYVLMLIESSYKIDGLISQGICVNSMQISSSALGVAGKQTHSLWKLGIFYIYLKVPCSQRRYTAIKHISEGNKIFQRGKQHFNVLIIKQLEL